MHFSCNFRLANIFNRSCWNGHSEKTDRGNVWQSATALCVRSLWQTIQDCKWSSTASERPTSVEHHRKHRGEYKYSASFMKCALLLRDTNDAYQMGDGNRILFNSNCEYCCHVWETIASTSCCCSGLWPTAMLC